MDYDYCMKIMIVGEQSVGKTAIMTRFCDDMFSPMYIHTLGLDYKSKKIEINGKIIKIQVWDTAGQERFNTIISSYYRGASGIFLVYDLTNLQSFKRVAFWMENIDKYAKSGVEIALIGNKSDLTDKRMLTSMDGEQLARSFGVPYYESSAKSNININEAFFDMSRTIFSKLQNVQPIIKDTIKLKKNNKMKKCSC